MKQKGLHNGNTVANIQQVLVSNLRVNIGFRCFLQYFNLIPEKYLDLSTTASI
jgi:hypothetical protein